MGGDVESDFDVCEAPIGVECLQELTDDGDWCADGILTTEDEMYEGDGSGGHD